MFYTEKITDDHEEFCIERFEGSVWLSYKDKELGDNVSWLKALCDDLSHGLMNTEHIKLLDEFLDEHKLPRYESYLIVCGVLSVANGKGWFDE